MGLIWRAAAFLRRLSPCLFLLLLGAAAWDDSGRSPDTEGTPLRAARLLLSEGFDACSFSPGWSGSFVNYQYYPPGENPFPAMGGHGCVLEQYIPRGLDDITPAQVGLDDFLPVAGTREVDELYVEWDEFFPRDHDFANGAQKALRFIYASPSGETNDAEVNLMYQVNNTNIQLSVVTESSEDGTPVDLAGNSNMAFPTERWVHVGVWCRMNTPGSRDGFCRAYLDSRPIAALDGISFRPKSGHGFNLMWVGGNHTNWGPTTQASRRYIDNVKWWDTKPAVSAPPRLRLKGAE